MNAVVSQAQLCDVYARIHDERARQRELREQLKHEEGA